MASSAAAKRPGREGRSELADERRSHLRLSWRSSGSVRGGTQSSTPRGGVKFLCQREIFFRETTLIVGGERQSDLVPANVDVRMVPGLLGELRDGVDKLDGGDEVLELVSARDHCTLPVPFGQGLQRDFDLGRSHSGHGPRLSPEESRVTWKTAISKSGRDKSSSTRWRR